MPDSETLQLVPQFEVPEIGRLRQLVEIQQQEAAHDVSLIADLNQEARSLRALNAELREALKGCIFASENLCKADFSEYRNAFIAGIKEARAILAKSEATIPEPSSAPPNRGPGLPAQDNPPQPAPGGTATTRGTNV